MKVLWVSNTIFPDLAEALGFPNALSGGWMYDSAKQLAQNGVNLAVATCKLNVSSLSRSINGLQYYLLRSEQPKEFYDPSLVHEWQKVIEEFNPNLVHIHGTEFAHGLVLMNTYPNLKYVISIQGLITAIAREYLAGISKQDVRRHITFRDLVKGSTLFQEQRKFQRRGEMVEKVYLQKSTDVIGRTNWDRKQVLAANASITYHFCNESLRQVFYGSDKWDINTKKDHSLFVSQALYPLKGVHKVLEAINLLTAEFPTLQLRIAGPDITAFETLRDKIRLSGYGRYIRSLIKRYKLQDHVTFLGPLNAAQMRLEYLKSHIFICPSSIENSPNSVGEAQLLGTPCIGAQVGGVPDMIEHGISGMIYPFEDVATLAKLIRTLFTDPELAVKVSQQGQIGAAKRHDRTFNLKQLMQVYESILGNRKLTDSD